MDVCNLVPKVASGTNIVVNLSFALTYPLTRL
jgi:hypothetical protein